jgi:ABC-type transporter Mla MlaB component
LVTVQVTGPVTRAEVARWRTAFLDGLARGSGLCIDLAASGPWDLAGVQLLLATMASARRTGQPINLVHVPDVLTKAAERAAVRERLAALIVDRAPAETRR